MGGEHSALLGVTIAGKYRIRRLIGTGGMGAVYEGEHIDLGKRIAVKIIDAGAALSSELTTRFKREARAASAVESEGIVQVFDVGRDPDFGLYMVMELLIGEDLEMTLRKLPHRRMEPAMVANASIQIARALHKAHQARVIHRDLKPANIFLSEREDGTLRVKVLDFGISKLLASEASMMSKKDMLALTQEGVALGTPQYMSPEQAQGLTTVDHRSDVWGLGAVMYEALAGVPPYKEEPSYEAVIMKILLERPPQLVDVAPWVPKALAKIVHEALEHDVKKRIPSCDDLARRVLEAVPDAMLGSTGPFRALRSLAQPSTEPQGFKPPGAPAAQERGSGGAVVSAPAHSPRSAPTDPPPADDTQVVVRPSNPNELAAAQLTPGTDQDDPEPSMTMVAEGVPSTRRDAPPKVIVRGSGSTPAAEAEPKVIANVEEPPPSSEAEGDRTVFQKPAWISSGDSPTTLKNGVAVRSLETTVKTRGRSRGLMVGAATALGVLLVGAVVLSFARGSSTATTPDPNQGAATTPSSTASIAERVPATAQAPVEPTATDGFAAAPPATGTSEPEVVAPSPAHHHHATSPSASAAPSASAPAPAPKHSGAPADGENPYAAPTPTAETAPVPAPQASAAPLP